MRATLILLAVILAGCGSDGDGTTTTSTTTGGETPAAVELQVATSGTYPLDPGFDPAALQVPAGATVNLTFTNEDINPVVVHDWVLEGVEGAATSQLASGESDTITFVAPTEPGEYAYYCSVGDHRQQGMEGVLTVV